MPNNDTLQILYGALPLIVIIVGVWFRNQIILKDILARLDKMERKNLKN